MRERKRRSEREERDRTGFENIVGDGAVDFEVITREHYDSIIEIRRNGIAGDS